MAISRRDFLSGAAVAASAGAASRLLAQEKPAADSPIPRRKLGRTGLEVSMISLGGWHMGADPDEKKAVALVRRAYELGINFFDNAWLYHDGRSEEFLGKALDGIRDKVFVMTKGHERTRAGAARQIDESLKRLRTDHIDLWQFHQVESAEIAESLFKEGGAMEAAETALKAGKILHLGFTGHRDPAAHMRALDDPRIETIQMPVNALDAHYLSFQKGPLPKAREKGVGVIAMKTLSCGKALERKVYSVDEALRYTWTLGPDVLVSGCTSIDQLEHNVALAKSFAPMPEAEKTALLDRIKGSAGTEIEWYKKKA